MVDDEEIKVDLKKIKYIGKYFSELEREFNELLKSPVKWIAAIFISALRSLVYIGIVWLIFIMGYFYSISGNSIEKFGEINGVQIEVRPPISGIDLYSKINEVMGSVRCGRGAIVFSNTCVSDIFKAQNKVLYTLALFVSILYLGIIPLMDKLIKKLVSGDTK